MGGGGGTAVYLPATIRSVVELSIADSMQGIAAVATAAVEARSSDDDRG